MDIYVGNLPYETDEETLQSVFGEYGEVSRVKIIEDRNTGRPKGFAFVTMADFKEGQNAIKALDGTDLGGRPLRVNKAEPRESRPPRSGGGFGGGRGNGGGGFNRGGRR